MKIVHKYLTNYCSTLLLLIIGVVPQTKYLVRNRETYLQTNQFLLCFFFPTAASFKDKK